MLENIKSMLSNGSGISSNRVMFVLWNIALITGMFYLYITKGITDETNFLMLGTLSLIWAGKVIQKTAEKHEDKK